MFKKAGLFFIAIFLMGQSFVQADLRSNYDENGVLILPSEARVFNVCEDIRASQIKYFYYSGGEAFQKISCKNQQKYGLFQQFYPNGVLWIEEDYREGLVNGISRTFDRNGNLQKYAKYESGSIVEIKEYDKNGNELGQDQAWAEVFNNKEVISEVSRVSVRPVNNIVGNEFWK